MTNSDPLCSRGQHTRGSSRSLASYPQSHAESRFDGSPADSLADRHDSALLNCGEDSGQNSSPDRAQDRSSDCSSSRPAKRPGSRGQKRPDNASASSSRDRWGNSSPNGVSDSPLRA
jgi:hypothetical protein